jgi:hypothetical protein
VSIEHSPARARGSRAINEWCEDHRISRSMFYKLKKQGLAPDLMKLGKAVRITDDADARWQAAREAAAKTTHP